MKFRAYSEHSLLSLKGSEMIFWDYGHPGNFITVIGYQAEWIIHLMGCKAR